MKRAFRNNHHESSMRVISLILLGALFLLGAEMRGGELLFKEATTYRLEGQRFQQQGDLKMAEASYRKAIATNPRYADAYNDLGVVLESLGDLSHAQEAYTTALKINPSLPGVHSNLALLYERLGKVEQAAPHWGARVRMGPEEDPWVQKAREKLIQYKLPVPETEASIAKKRGSEANMAYEAGGRHLKAKQWDQAVQEFQRALSLDPTHKKAAAGLREAQARLKGKEAAREKEMGRAQVQMTQERETVAPKAEEVSPPSVPSVVPPPEAEALAGDVAREKSKTRLQTTRELYQRALTAMRDGQFEEAVMRFQQVLTLDPDYKEARQGLKRAQTASAKGAQATKP